MATLSNYWHYRYSFNYETFISGISNGSGLALQDTKILSAMVGNGLPPSAPRNPGTE